MANKLLVEFIHKLRFRKIFRKRSNKGQYIRRRPLGEDSILYIRVREIYVL